MNGQKLGLGSSARAAVLAVEAARHALGGKWDSLKLALLAHFDAQGGKGSGGDVAASFAGGVIRYRRFDVAPLAAASVTSGLTAALEKSPPVELARLGEPLFPCVYAFSGESASTTSLVKQVEQKLGVEGRKRFVDRSDAHSAALENGLLRRDLEQLKTACGALQALLWELDVTRNDAIDRILGLARTFGCAAKQSGAGGGDGAIIFAPDDAVAAEVSNSLESRGFHTFLTRADRGVQGEVTPHAELARWLD